MNGAREHKSNMNKPRVDYAEKVNDKYVNIEKFVKRFVCLTNRINHKYSGLLLPVLRGGYDWDGNVKDFAVLCCADNYDSGYALVEVDSVRSITICRRLEQKFEHSTKEQQKEMLDWFTCGPTAEDLKKSWLHRQTREKERSI